MTGRELIKLIQDNHAEDMPVIIQYCDPAGGYATGKDAEFSLGRAAMDDETGEWDLFFFSKDEPNAIVL